jgi:acetyl esterase/lipase
LDAYLQRSQTPSAAVIFVHGGGFVGGDKKDYPHDLLDPLTENGFSTISVNYRLAPKHPFPAATDDVETAIAYVKQHARELRIDPRRLAMLGPSAGGLIVSYVGARHRPENRVAAVVSMFGEHDLVLRASENPCCMDGRVGPRPPGGCISGGLAALLGFSEIKTPEQQQRLREASAVSYVQKDMPAYLLIHGTRDYGVPFEQSVSMYETMTEAGADCTLIGIISGGHGNWHNLPQWTKERQHMVRWLLTKTIAR